VAELTVRDVTVRSVVVPLRRPLATKVGDFSRWPLLLIDVTTGPGITGRGYLAPYLSRAAAALRTVLEDMRAALRGSRRPASGSNGRTGPIPCWPAPSRSGTATCTCPPSPATAWNGTSPP
jgi:hypothetical protein